MANFDHDENTKSGIGGSHYTISMLFQNAAHEMGEKPKEISSKLLANFKRKALDRILNCQKLVHVTKYGARGQIPAAFIPSPPPDTQGLETSMNTDFVSWVKARFATKNHIPEYSSCENPSIPSFTTTNSLLY